MRNVYYSMNAQYNNYYKKLFVFSMDFLKQLQLKQYIIIIIV